MTKEELDALCAELAPVFMEYLKQNGTSVQSSVKVEDLTDVTHVLGIKSIEGVESLVLIPVSLLSGSAGSTDTASVLSESSRTAKAEFIPLPED